MSIYLDTSVLVSLYVAEPRTPKILKLIEETEDTICISRLVETEFHAVLAIKNRTKQLTKKTTKSIVNLFNHHLDQLIYQKMHISDEVFNLAIQYLSEHETNLRTLDALHLACNSILGTTLVTADKVLAQCAKQFKHSVVLI